MNAQSNGLLRLTDEVKALVDGAPSAGNPLLLAVVIPDGKPLISFRGSVQVFSDDQLGFWARNRGGATLDAIRLNPNVAFVYRTAPTAALQFYGRARVTEDEAERAKVFEQAHPYEQAADPERKGTAVIVQIDRVEGVLRKGPDGPVRCLIVRA
jgi:hypothetical protein